MKLLYSGVSKELINNGINIKCTESTQERIIKSIFTKKASDMLGFLDLPYMPNEEVNKYIQMGKDISKMYSDFIVLGIGGSALGIKMLKNTFLDSINEKSKCNVRVCDNIDSDTFITTSEIYFFIYVQSDKNSIQSGSDLSCFGHSDNIFPL